MAVAPPQPYQRSNVMAAPFLVSPAAGVAVGFGALAGATAADVVVADAAWAEVLAAVEATELVAGAAVLAATEAVVLVAGAAVLGAAAAEVLAASRAVPRGITEARRKRSRREYRPDGRTWHSVVQLSPRSRDGDAFHEDALGHQEEHDHRQYHHRGRSHEIRPCQLLHKAALQQLKTDSQRKQLLTVKRCDPSRIASGPSENGTGPIGTHEV